jgi:hypothetical protein
MVLKSQGGYKDAEHWGKYGAQMLGDRNLPPQLKQMQPTGRRDEQGDEGRRRALEAATVARAEGDDWGSIAQSLRESPGAVGPLRSEERRQAEELHTIEAPSSVNASSRPVPFNARLADELAFMVYSQENVARVERKYPALTVRRPAEAHQGQGAIGLSLNCALALCPCPFGPHVTLSCPCL